MERENFANMRLDRTVISKCQMGDFLSYSAMMFHLQNLYSSKKTLSYIMVGR